MGPVIKSLPPPPHGDHAQLPKILDDLGVTYWRKEPVKTKDKAASNHGISAMKFQLIRVRGGGAVGVPALSACLLGVRTCPPLRDPLSVSCHRGSSECSAAPAV
jgi:hypothetical protein